MAYQSIGRGSAANDGTGDDLRTGAGKVNDNFVEVYTYLGDGSTLSSDAVVTETATQTLTNKTITGTFTGNVTGDVTGNADTATSLATARTIAGQSFDGSANITIAAQDLSDVDQDIATTDAVQFTGITSLGDNTDEGFIILNCETNAHGQTIKPQPHSASVTNTLTLPAGGNQELVGTDATQTLTNKTITGTFTGDITGNADTATSLATARTIAGQSFDGTANITIATTDLSDADQSVATTDDVDFNTVTLANVLQLAVYADTTARDAAAATPAAGMVVFVTDGDGGGTAQFQGYNGSAWVALN